MTGKTLAAKQLAHRIVVVRLLSSDGALLWTFSCHKNKLPICVSRQGVWNLILTMTYSHMGKPHTTIGDASFHC